jgi:hypothetical protein
MNSTNEITELKELLNQALRKLYENDMSLIERRANERAITFRFGIYFEELVKNSSFKELNVDAEYNRNGITSKYMPVELARVRTYPDILLHERGNNDTNKLIIEFKPYWRKNEAARQLDIKKLKFFTSKNCDYAYVLGAFVRLAETLEGATVEYFVNGEFIPPMQKGAGL